MSTLDIREATINDLQAICEFVDYWLAGRGLAHNAPGAVNDYFVSPSQHKKYIEKYVTFTVIIENKMVGWGVIQNDGSLIHFLIAGTHRGKGIGSAIIKTINPAKIHSKSNQSSGDPAGFYEHLGYEKTGTVKSKSRLDIDKIRPNRKPIIDIYEKREQLQNAMVH